MAMYKIVEHVVFEYTWLVEAPSKKQALAGMKTAGDGEAESHEEVKRTVKSIRVTTDYGSSEGIVANLDRQISLIKKVAG